MYTVKSSLWSAVTLPPLLFSCPHALALQAGGDVGMDLRYTNNANLVQSNEVEDLIAMVSAGGSVLENSGPLTGSATAVVRGLSYQDDTFDNQIYPELNAYADWEQVKNFLKWSVRDYYSQSSIDTLVANTPDNIEDINAFSFAAQLMMRPADRHTLTVTPSIDDYYYETSSSNNQQTGIAADWSYQYRPTVALSLNGSFRDVNYDDDTLNPGHTSTILGVSTTVMHSRSEYRGSVGVTSIEGDSGNDDDGTNAAISALYRLTGRSSLNANVSTDITNTSNLYLGTWVDPNTGNFSNIQTSNEVVRSRLLRIAYNRNGSTTDLSGWVELRELDYDTVNDDRKLQDYGVSVGYRVTAKMTASVSASYVKTEVENPAETDKYFVTDGQVVYALSRKLSAQGGVRFQKRTNTDPLQEYDEYSIFAGVGYHLGRK
jgi:hypothetical protein